MRLGILHTQIRADERLLIDVCRNKNIDHVLIDVRNELFYSLEDHFNIDVALERCVSSTKGLYAIKFFESVGLPVINSFDIANLCWDKYYTSLYLRNKGVPTVDFGMAFNETQAKQLVERLGGYPVVLKATTGSWGRLVSKINDEHALESIIEHKSILGGVHHQGFYIQDYVEKNGRDIRSFIVGNETIAAIYRNSDHWITNTARGGQAENCEITPELRDLGRMVTKHIGEGVLSLDVFETEDGLKVNEVNHTTEFKNSEKPTGVDISGSIIDYCVKVAQGRS